MTVGIPGAGIGGLFYILSALAAPLREVVALARRDASASPESRAIDRVRRRLALRQGAIAVGILAALWATGTLLGRLLAAGTRVAAAQAAGVQRVLPASALAVTFGSLAVVLLAVQVARLVLVPRAGGAGGTGA
jgi:hypothetical protein